MNVKKVFLWSFGLLFTLGILGCAAVAGLFYWASRDLPDLERLTGYEAPQATVILARDGSTIGTLATEKRYSITLKEMSPWLPMSFLAAEDDSFYQHHGVDPVAIVRAFIYNLRNKASGGGQQMPIFTAAGAKCTVLDYSEEQLRMEKLVADREGYTIDLIRADMTKPLPFEAESFDLIFHPVSNCYVEDVLPIWRECFRVLKKGGKLLNFDANWYGYLYDDKKREAYENDRRNVEKGSLDDHYLCTDIDRMEKIALQVPLSETKRPGWDVKVLEELKAEKIEVDENIWQQVWSEEEKLNYGSTPMFMIKVTK